MSKLSPTSWRDLVRKLRRLGFEGPHQKGKHPYMLKGNITVTIPNPHSREISIDLLVEILRQAGISRQEWIEA